MKGVRIINQLPVIFLILFGNVMHGIIDIPAKLTMYCFHRPLFRKCSLFQWKRRENAVLFIKKSFKRK